MKTMMLVSAPLTLSLQQAFALVDAYCAEHGVTASMVAQAFMAGFIHNSYRQNRVALIVEDAHRAAGELMEIDPLIVVSPVLTK